MATLDAADGEAAAKRQRVGGWAENCLNQGCRSVQCFRKLNRIWGAAVGSGRYDFPSFFHRLKKQSQVGQSFPIDFIFSSWPPKKKPQQKHRGKPSPAEASTKAPMGWSTAPARSTPARWWR